MIHENSRLYLSEIIRPLSPVGDVPIQPDFFAYRKRYTKEDASDARLAVTGAYNWAQYGLNYLDDARNWWAIADLSKVTDVFSEPQDLDYLICPSQDRFFFGILDTNE